MEKYLVLATFVGSIIALLFALITGKRVLSYEEGTPLMSKISRSIREGANAYLRRQYTVVGIFFACMVVVLCVMAGCKLLTWFVPFAFLTGGFFSGLSGFVGMRIATKANCRTANACRDGLNKGLRVAFSAGSVMGFTVVGLGLLDISVWFLLLRFVFKLEAADITSAMLTFGMGASSMALFARVGGGIFTKAADVGADLVGKVEAGIPEDDPRNPAVIADNVGDNVGDVAGMGADLYESYVGSIISASALGVASFSGQAFKAMAIPMVMAAVGILCSIIGSFFVKTDENADQRTLLKALSRGTNLAAILIAVISFFLVWALLGIEHWGLYVAILSGLVAGVLIGKELAQRLGLVVGSRVNLLSPSGQKTTAGFQPRIRPYKVAGIFQTGMFEYDSSLGFISLAAARDLLGLPSDQISGIEVTVKDVYKADTVAAALQKELGPLASVRTWMDMNANLFAALKLEKIGMFILLAMVVLIGSFSIVTTLVMLVMEKTHDIAILMSMGATKGMIRRIFMLQGTIIGVVGTLLGYVLGIGLALLLQRYQFIKLPPGVYTLDHLPILLNWVDIVVVGVSAMTLCFLATIYPARQAASLEPAEALRFE